MFYALYDMMYFYINHFSLFEVVANSFKSNKSWVSRKNINKRNKTRRNWTNKDGRFTRDYSDFRAEVLQIYKFWTQMILGGN